jgi:hypothetical protein
MRALRDGRVLSLSNIKNQKQQLYIIDIAAGTTEFLCEDIDYDPSRISLRGVLSVLHLQNDNFVYASETYGANPFLMLISNGQEVRRHTTTKISALAQLENGSIVIGSDIEIIIFDQELTTLQCFRSVGYPREISEIGANLLALSYGSTYKFLNLNLGSLTETRSTQPACTSFTKIATDKYIKFNFFEGHQVFATDSESLITTIPARASDTCTVIESGEFLTFHSHESSEIKLYNINQKVVERTYHIPRQEMILGIVLN